MLMPLLVVCTTAQLCAANREKSHIDKSMEFIGIKNFEHETKGG
jgi:hypothetical protein